MADKEPSSGGDENTDGFVEDIVAQVEDLAPIHNHITRIVENLDVDTEWFDGYDDPNRAKYDLEMIVLIFLYKYTQGFTQSELARRLRGAAYVHIRFGLDQPLSQQIISHNERNRFTPLERRTLKTAAERIHKICDEHDINLEHDPNLEPEDFRGDGFGDEQITTAVETAMEYGFGEFSADRASNAKYPLEAFFERQAYLNMAKAGATSKRRRFARMSNRDEVPHGSTHNRTVKKMATPDVQLSFDEFVNGTRVPHWKRIRDTVLDPFHTGVERMLDEVAGRDREGFREPVHAAIDIVGWNFWPSPFKSEADAAPGEKPVPVTERNNGTKTQVEKYLKADYPEMVSGFKRSDERGYKFATITIVAEETPIVLGIEPVRDGRGWEQKDVETTSRADIVERLLAQASQHVDIQKVFLDRGFDSIEVRDIIDRHSSTYVLGKTKNADIDKKQIEEIKEDSVYDGRVKWGSLEYEGREHDISYIYHPVDRGGQKYAIFTVNAHVDPDRAQALISQYSQRMEIENQYKSIKAHFLPTTCSSDYRTRFLAFVIGVVMYNMWRVTNFIVRDEVAVHLGENPPIPAGELVELIGFFLFDPPD